MAANVRREIGAGEIYLDWNATTPLLPQALQAMHAAAEQSWANPASVHAAGRRARAVVEDTRETLAALLQVNPRDVIFTSGGTEANNLALSAAPGLVTSRLEHPSVVRCAEALAARGVPVQWLPVPPSGQLEVSAVEQALANLPQGSWVAVMAANHETGVIQPIAEIGEVVHCCGARLHVDAVQGLGKLPPELWRVADSVAVAAHKIRGPKGIGALAWRNNTVTPKPVLLGGSQERGLRPGTQDAVLAAGFTVALQWAALGPERYAALAPLRDTLERALSDGAEVNGASGLRLPHVANLAFRGWKGAELAAALDLEGLRVSSGSACSAGTSEPSAVISAMWGVERAASSVRFSLGETTEAKEIERAISIVKRVVTR